MSFDSIRHFLTRTPLYDKVKLGDKLVDIDNQVGS